MKITLLSHFCKSVALITRAFLTIGVFFFVFPAHSLPLSSSTLLSTLLNRSTPLVCHTSDLLLRDLSFWLNTQKGDASFSTFQDLTHFILHHPSWPRLVMIQKMAEEKLKKETVPPHKKIAFFKIYPPLTLTGQIHYICALLDAQQHSVALTHLRTYWQSTPLNPADQALFLKRFGKLLHTADHEKRLMSLLWRGEESAARDLLQHAALSPSLQGTAQKVLTLLSKDTSRLPSPSTLLTMPQQSEIVLWAHLKALRNHKAYPELCKAFLKIPKHLKDPKAFHRLRVLAAREALEMQNPQQALTILGSHGLPPGPEQADAEWLMGWIALSFLKQPSQALQHFKNFEKNVRTPISLARAGYWLGRSYQALHQPDKAKKAFERAATYRTAFYGQMACYELKKCPFPLLLSHPKVSLKDRQAFEKQELVRAIRLLAPLGSRAHIPLVYLLCALGSRASRTAERQLIVELASQVHPYIAVDLSRTLHTKDPWMPLLKAAYPLPPTPQGLTPHEKIFTLAICYRESRFNPTIRGEAGEIGLMQLMPQTATEVAASLKLPHSPTRLLDPQYNMRLGSCLLRDLGDKFNQNCCLVAAGYNGGAGAVNRWLQGIGDPQHTVWGCGGPTRDRFINWIEAIPYEGTRDYVHRALEAYLVYAGCLGQPAQTAWNTLFHPLEKERA